MQALLQRASAGGKVVLRRAHRAGHGACLRIERRARLRHLERGLGEGLADRRLAK